MASFYDKTTSIFCVPVASTLARIRIVCPCGLSQPMPLAMPSLTSVVLLSDIQLFLRYQIQEMASRNDDAESLTVVHARLEKRIA